MNKINVPKIAVIGPVTKDKIVIGKRYEKISTGGCVFYCGRALGGLGIKTTVFMTLSQDDLWIKNNLSNNIKVIPIFKPETAYFENIYPRKSMDYRIQRAKPVNNPITINDLKGVDFNDFDYVILGSLQVHDFPLETIKYLSKFDTKVCMALQGFLRDIRNDKVYLREFKDKKNFLQYVDVAILNEDEAKSLIPGSKLEEICINISSMGPEETIITKGSKGSLIYSRKKDMIYKIPAFVTESVIDATGAGDSYLAGYVVKHLETNNLQKVGEFSAMTATLNLENRGHLDNSKIAINLRLKINKLLREEGIHKKYN